MTSVVRLGALALGMVCSCLGAYNRVGIDNKAQDADISSRDEGLRKNPVSRSISTSVRPHPLAMRETGYRPAPARLGSRTSVFMARRSPISTGVGSSRTSRCSQKAQGGGRFNECRCRVKSQLKLPARVRCPRIASVNHRMGLCISASISVRLRSFRCAQ